MKPHLRSIFVVSLATFAAASLVAQTALRTMLSSQGEANAGEPVSFGEWSETVKDLRARLIVSKDAQGNAVAYLEFQRMSRSVNPLQIYYGAALSWSNCELRDPGGKIVAPQPRMADGPMPPAYSLTLPADSILRFVSNPVNIIPGTSAGGELVILAGMDCWRVAQAGDATDHYLSGTLNLTVPNGGISPLASSGGSSHTPTPVLWQGTLKLPPVKIPASNKL